MTLRARTALFAVAALVAVIIGIQMTRSGPTAPDAPAKASAPGDRQGGRAAIEVAGSAAGNARRDDTIRRPDARPRPFGLPPSADWKGEVRAALAKGEPWDALAAYRLGAFGVHCRTVAAAVDGGAMHPSEVETTAATLALCDGLPPRFRDDPLGQLRSAAEAGVVEAQVAYAALASTELSQEALLRDPQKAERFKRDAMRYLHEAAWVGSVDALSELAHAYHDGMITRRDPVAAYAYMDAVAKTGLVPSAPRVLGMWGAQLSPGQLQAARTLSGRIHRQCCR